MTRNIFVEDIQNDTDMVFVTYSQDVTAIKEYLGAECDDDIDRFDSFFVKATDGDYEEVLGMVGIVPYFDKVLVRIR